MAYRLFKIVLSLIAIGFGFDLIREYTYNLLQPPICSADQGLIDSLIAQQARGLSFDAACIIMLPLIIIMIVVASSNAHFAPHEPPQWLSFVRRCTVHWLEHTLFILRDDDIVSVQTHEPDSNARILGTPAPIDRNQKAKSCLLSKRDKLVPQKARKGEGPISASDFSASNEQWKEKTSTSGVLKYFTRKQCPPVPLVPRLRKSPPRPQVAGASPHHRPTSIPNVRVEQRGAFFDPSTETLARFLAMIERWASSYPFYVQRISEDNILDFARYTSHPAAQMNLWQDWQMMERLCKEGKRHRRLECSKRPVVKSANANRNFTFTIYTDKCYDDFNALKIWFMKDLHWSHAPFPPGYKERKWDNQAKLHFCQTDPYKGRMQMSNKVDRGSGDIATEDGATIFLC